VASITWLDERFRQMIREALRTPEPLQNSCDESKDGIVAGFASLSPEPRKFGHSFPELDKLFGHQKMISD
jgi:hypothetical protein